MSARAGLIVQTEVRGDRPRYLELGPEELRGIASALERLLRASGVEPGQRMLVYDFSTSLSALALTRAYAPGLDAGACDSIGCSVISLDGLPSLASRTAFFYRLLRPEVLMIRRELLAPLRAKLGGSSLSSVIVTSPEPVQVDVPGASSVRTLYVLDEALFMAIVRGGRAMYPGDLYESRCDDGNISVRPRFASGLGFTPTAIRCTNQEVSAI
ncbi:MAG: hypothetical protein RAK18_04070 [Conexivisphaerales archaeon]|nr:hypothetical protein [Conexivisphaerales archaeon]